SRRGRQTDRCSSPSGSLRVTSPFGTRGLYLFAEAAVIVCSSLRFSHTPTPLSSLLKQRLEVIPQDARLMALRNERAVRAKRFECVLIGHIPTNDRIVRA